MILLFLLYNIDTRQCILKNCEDECNIGDIDKSNSIDMISVNVRYEGSYIETSLIAH